MRFCLAGVALAVLVSSAAHAEIPADRFDLSFWKLTVPLDDNGDGKVDEIKVRELQDDSHPDFFYLDQNGYLVRVCVGVAVHVQ